ncbi:hypothetical protein ABH931_002117 [Streptacidiphilus sp. MAP12-33]|uniref:hypothetical protein n=1 Tax=Streptacidiphilus sp. MAP12-33 TaxID=3156266 RepID=UPI003516C64C
MEDLDNKGGEPRRRTLDLSLTQVVSSALAAVVGAVLASQLGVYGTFLGAAVVSIGATTGSAVFQHVFRRTGEQFREMTTTPVPVDQVRQAEHAAGPEETRVFDPFDPGGEHTRMMARISPPGQGEAVTVYRGRTNVKPKSWKVYAVTAAIVFALAMATVGVIELASGKPASHFFDGGGGGKPGGGNSAPANPSPGASSENAGGTGGQKDGGASPDAGTSSSPGASTSTSPHPSGSTGPTSGPTPPTSSPQSSSGTGNSGTGNSGTGNSGSGDSASGSGTSGDAAMPQGAPPSP